MKLRNRLYDSYGYGGWDGCIVFLLMCLLGLLFGLAFILLFAFIGEWLWNGLMVEKFGMPSLDYWEMVGLMVLFRILMPTGINIRNGK